MKIYTYPNPFTITSTPFWDEIKDYPHLCISQTLVQGLSTYYGRDKFSFIYTVDSFMKRFYKLWTDNPENDIAQYISISDRIEEIQDKNIKKAMKFNQKDIVSSIRFLIELGIDGDSFKRDNLTKEQEEFLRIYKVSRTDSSWRKLDKLKNLQSDSVEAGMLELLKEEINKSLGLKNDEKTTDAAALEKEIDQRLKGLNKEKQELTNSIRDKNKKKSVEQRIKSFEKYKKILMSFEEKTTGIRHVVLHGIHQFTPIILKLVNHLESIGIEVVFVVNYSKEFSRVYETWKSVYSWTGKNFSHVSCMGDFFGQPVGKFIGDLLEGRDVSMDELNHEIKKYDNLTTFVDNAAKIYEDARKKAEEIEEKRKKANSGKKGKDEVKVNVLAQMYEQFYAVNSSKPNDILKVYFPDQFGDKHFLTYPVGQFILGLYNMWDSEKKTLIISESTLKECLAVNFWPTSLNETPIGIYEKIKLYFKNVETIEDFKKRLTQLKFSIGKVESEPDSRRLKKFSFYSVTGEEIAYFEEIIKDISKMAEKIFALKESGKVDYKSHYKKLLEVISDKTQNEKLVSEKEVLFVKEIESRLSNVESLEVEGTIEDLKQTLHFYLHRKTNENSANWIIRDFEQIDGGVLLSKEATVANYYHYALLSDSNMKIKSQDYFAWPLSEEMFGAYEGDAGRVDIILKAYREYKNFLRYSLFYGTYFLQKQIKFSYIENSEGEKDVPYFLLNFMGLKIKDESNKITDFDTGREEAAVGFQGGFSLNSFEDLDRSMFSVCPYRYFLNNVVEDRFYYQNEFQIRYYYIVVLFARVWKKLQGKPIHNLRDIVHQENEVLRKYFPFWEKVDFIDIENKVIKDIKRDDNMHMGNVKSYDESYVHKKEHFLLAQITEDNRRLINFRSSDRSHVEDYMRNYGVDEMDNNKINPKICQYCNQRETCLKNFIEGDFNAESADAGNV
jgi:hypothetical protein